MLRTLPQILFITALALTAFGYGVASTTFEWPPFDALRSAYRTAVTAARSNEEDKGRFLAFTDVPVERTREQRFERLEDAVDGATYLVSGGRHQFQDYCPQWGCAAIELAHDGSLLRTIPFLPGRIVADEPLENLPYEDMFLDPLRHLDVGGMDSFPNGDLVMTLAHAADSLTFPYGGGLVRIDATGNPIWYRRDYSHHWPHITEDGDILVPSTTIADPPLAVEVLETYSFNLECDGKIYFELINVVDGDDGRLVQQVPVMKGVMASPHAAVLMETTNPCDPLHINYVREIGPEMAAALPNAQADDLILSMRNISAIGIVDRREGTLKRLIRGTFIQQHSVQPLAGSQVLMFDNLGGGTAGGPSRLLMVDIARGTEETIFPNQQHRQSTDETFSQSSGNVDVSGDVKRALVTFSYSGTTYEVDLETRRVLTMFRSLHDVRGIKAFDDDDTENAALFRTLGVYYASPPGAGSSPMAAEREPDDEA